VLEGLLLGETAPHTDERRKIEQPTLIVGHSRDPVHPFSDSGMLAEELVNGRLVEANSILEWRLRPKRLNGELAGFLDEVWASPEASPDGDGGDGELPADAALQES
jgi:pimeloyl-ACP methyl ester carboxylesterase